MDFRGIYHVFNKSIAGYKIYNSDSDFGYMVGLFEYYVVSNRAIRYSELLCPKYATFSIESKISSESNLSKYINIIAFCIMPTHFHLVLEELEDGAISNYTKIVLNAYSHYFNNKYNRKGPLWQGRTKRVLVESDEQLIHLTRYVHLNPVTAKLIDRSEDWVYSSYREYIDCDRAIKICDYSDFLDIEPNRYKKFCNERIDEQRDLAVLKKLHFD